MTEDQAITIVQRARGDLDLNPALEVHSAEQAIVQCTDDRSRPGPLEDRVAWIVSLSGNFGHAVVQVDDATGDILDVRRIG